MCSSKKMLKKIQWSILWKHEFSGKTISFNGHAVVLNDKLLYLGHYKK